VQWCGGLPDELRLHGSWYDELWCDELRDACSKQLHDGSWLHDVLQGGKPMQWSNDESWLRGVLPDVRWCWMQRYDGWSLRGELPDVRWLHGSWWYDGLQACERSLRERWSCDGLQACVPWLRVPWWYVQLSYDVPWCRKQRYDAWLLRGVLPGVPWSWKQRYDGSWLSCELQDVRPLRGSSWCDGLPGELRMQWSNDESWLRGVLPGELRS
jgi:hypothetical protein